MPRPTTGKRHVARCHTGRLADVVDLPFIVLRPEFLQRHGMFTRPTLKPLRQLVPCDVGA